ncbi:penicillin-binding protein activator [Colwellia echini]|uniref:Penicillin-binding protein activator n=1 Tax=Colwellia echini TaxID=1982103 RepID=A0ABY3MY89_9GAMM|nr:penicillin-binding protein activator [Colwellia echini]
MVRLQPSQLNYFSRTTQQLKLLILPALLLGLLSSCSTKQAPLPPVTEIEKITLKPGSLTAEQHVELAKNASTEVAVSELLVATKLYYQEENYSKALWLAEKTLPLIDDKTPNYTHQIVQLSLIKASSLQHLGYYPESYQQLTHIEQYAKTHKIILPATYYRLLHAAYQQGLQPIAALNAQLLEFSATPSSAQSTEQIESIWQGFQALSQWQLSLVALDNAPDSDGWLALTSKANKFGGNQDQLQYHLRMWQGQFKLHPANIIAKQLIAQTLELSIIENVAVIIPLSGKQKSAGLAIQQGILASFANDETKKLHFIDSNTVNWYGLTNELSMLKTDYVIGPLLKSNVDKYIMHTSTVNQAQNDYMLNASADLFNNTDDSKLPSAPLFTNPNDFNTAIDSEYAINSYLQPQNKTYNTLLLNIPSKAGLANNYTVLSMRPEDEAKQAAATLSRQNFKHPIVLSQQNVVSKRIAQAFAKQWKLTTGEAIDVVYYDSSAQMQNKIKTSLAVDNSTDRINTLKRSLNQSIKTQTRNRRDVDMIYLVGTPEQTRLVKPYIEVNISPFAQIIPVYASSRSHSTQSDDSTNSDLQGLTFTEIPWLLPGEQNASLANLSQELWPNRIDGLSRLFAMGYDSYQLINKIPLMQQAPYLQHWGQTGVLMMGDNNILTRSLLWGAYKNNKVVPIDME